MITIEFKIKFETALAHKSTLQHFSKRDQDAICVYVWINGYLPQSQGYSLHNHWPAHYYLMM